MNIEDQSAERKNLMMTSIAFIVYYYGKAEMDGNQLNLPFINVNFHNPDLLGCMAWFALLWFFYRFTLSHGRDFLNEFPAEFLRYRNDPKLNQYMKNKTNFHNSQIVDFKCTKIKWKIINIYALSTFRTRGNSSPQGMHSDKHLFDDVQGTIIGIRLTIKCFMQNPSFSQSLSPYLLAFLAITAPVFS